MDDNQLNDFLAALDAEFKNRRNAKSKARGAKRRSSGIETARHIPKRCSFKINIQLDPVADATLRLVQLMCDKFAVSADDRKELSKAMVHAFMLGRKREFSENESERLKRVSEATNGRRLIGATSRAKVKQEALAFRHLSKENAASKISPIVNLDTGTIRRYLSQLFPGSEWKQ